VVKCVIGITVASATGNVARRSKSLMMCYTAMSDSPAQNLRRKRALALPSYSDEESQQGRPSAPSDGEKEQLLSITQPLTSASGAAPASPHPSTSGTVPSWQCAVSASPRPNRRERRFRRRQTLPDQPAFSTSSDED
jgi:hypothetical protein